MKRAKEKKKTENISWGDVRRGVRSDGKPLGSVPVSLGTYQGGTREYHRLDWPASGQQQCIAGGQLNNNNNTFNGVPDL